MNTDKIQALADANIKFIESVREDLTDDEMSIFLSVVGSMIISVKSEINKIRYHDGDPDGGFID